MKLKDTETKILNYSELNSLPSRVEINGKRHYNTPFYTGPAPSVTTILSETASEKNKKKLEMWSKANPGVKEAAAHRGTYIHAGMEHYCKKEPYEIPEEYQEFWEGMPAILDQFNEIIWAETPFLEEHQFALAEDGVGRVWGKDKEDRAWAGSPDLIGYVGGKLTLADLKTSIKPYSRYWPKNLEKGCKEWRDLLGGYMKFKKTLKQLAAYDMGIEQTLNIKVEQAAVLVSTPNKTQIFKITRNYLDILRKDWLKIIEEYYNQIERCVMYEEDLI